MTRFKVRYSREYSKIIYARNSQEAMWKFNKEADENSEFISADEEINNKSLEEKEK